MGLPENSDQPVKTPPAPNDNLLASSAGETGGPDPEIFEPQSKGRQALCLAGTFFGSIALGWVVGQTPGGMSENARTALIVPFPVIFGFGYALWSARLKAIAFEAFGRGLLRTVFRLVFLRQRPKDFSEVLPPPETLRRMVIRAQRAASSFLIVSIPVGIVAGLLSFLADTSWSVGLVPAWVFATSVAWGTFLSRIGRRGYLPMLEEE